MAVGAVKEAMPKNEVIKEIHKVTDVLANNKKVLTFLSVVNFIVIFIIPHYYYGFVRKTLFSW